MFGTKALGMFLIELCDRDLIKMFDVADELIGFVEHADFDEGEKLGRKLIRLIGVRIDGLTDLGFTRDRGSRANA